MARERKGGCGMRAETHADVVIVGCGIAGLYTALHLPKTCQILLISKGRFDECDSMLAEQGLSVLPGPRGYDAFYGDTLRAGRNQNLPERVDDVIHNSPAVLRYLRKIGVGFTPDDLGNIGYRQGPGHTKPRLVYKDDCTGKAITTALFALAKKSYNITLLENTTVTDLETRSHRCVGVIMRPAGGRAEMGRARYTVLATGGIGGLYTHSSNFRCLTGDGIALARRYGIAMEHLDDICINPTALYTGKPGRSYMIPAAAREQGAVLLSAAGSRFVDEKLPDEVVANAVRNQLLLEDSRSVRLSFASIPTEQILREFKAVHEHCLAEGYDITKEPVPVVPAEDYMAGGIKVNQRGATSMPNLYAVGETSYTGAHGRAPLIGNSMMEAMVFAAHVARDIERLENDREKNSNDFLRYTSLRI